MEGTWGERTLEAMSAPCSTCGVEAQELGKLHAVLSVLVELVEVILANNLRILFCRSVSCDMLRRRSLQSTTLLRSS